MLLDAEPVGIGENSDRCCAVAPVPCLIVSAASGQSVATRSGPACRMSLNRGPASFIDSSKYSFFRPHVPSTAEQRSTVSTSAPVRRKTSADLVPRFCALRWHGSW